MEILQALVQHYSEAARIGLSNDGLSGSNNHDFNLLLSQCDILRYKRILISYHRVRLEHLSKLMLCLPSFPSSVKQHLSKSEGRFQAEYISSLNSILATYNNTVSINGRLAPPKSLYTCVRVVKDCGVVQTEFGPLYLNQNSFHYVRKSDVEHLISQGYLLHVK